MTTFQDIFKKSFLEGYAASGLTTKSIIFSLLLASAFALYIFIVYRSFTRKTFYSKSFNISLAALTVITAAVILTIQSSIVVSLGMVGALSIVRFRTAVKDPMDLVFLFWAISIGIICGAGLGEMAVIVSLIITAMVIALDNIKIAKAPLLLVLNVENPDDEDEILGTVETYCKYSKVKSRNLTKEKLHLIVELRTDKGKELVRELAAREGIFSVTLMEHDGEAVC